MTDSVSFVVKAPASLPTCWAGHSILSSTLALKFHTMQFDSLCLGLLFILFLFYNCPNHFKGNNLPLVNTLVHKQLVFTCGVTTRIKIHKSD